MTDTQHNAVSICVVLDRSGSMESCREDAVKAVNSYVKEARLDRSLKRADVSMIIFDSDGIDLIRDHVPVANCQPVTCEEYEPRAMTPLYDAVGYGINRLDQGGNHKARRILVIMTDGLENASREHDAKSISVLLKRKQDKENWLVVYLGADHDAWAQARNMGVKQASVARFSKSKFAGTSQSLQTLSARYASAADAEAVCESGFTDNERESMKESD